MTKLSIKLAGAFAAAVSLAALGASTSASAQVSDTLTVFDPLGNIVASASITEALEDAGTIVVVPIGIDAAQFGNATNLVELNGNFSDIFGICTCGPNGALALGIASDTETQGVNFGSFPRTFPEGNGVFSATLYLDPALQAQGFTATFTSDPSVPEPATWAMMIAGFGLVGVAMRRKANVLTA